MSTKLMDNNQNVMYMTLLVHSCTIAVFDKTSFAFFYYFCVYHPQNDASFLSFSSSRGAGVPGLTCPQLGQYTSA